MVTGCAKIGRNCDVTPVAFFETYFCEHMLIPSVTFFWGEVGGGVVIVLRLVKVHLNSYTSGFVRDHVTTSILMPRTDVKILIFTHVSVISEASELDSKSSLVFPHNKRSMPLGTLEKYGN